MNKFLCKQADAGKYRPGQFSGGAHLSEELSSSAVAQVVSNAVPALSIPLGVANLIGAVAGSSADADKDDLKDLASYSVKSMLPGVGPYRNMRRDSIIDKHHSKGERVSSVAWSERFGGLLSMLALASLGAGVGAYASKDDRLGAAILGGLGGMGLGALANVGGLIGGFVQKPRTAEKHAEYLSAKNSPLLINYLVPGAAGYNLGRRYRSMWNKTI